MADDLSWMNAIPDAVGASPAQSPASPAWTPPPGFHPAPDGSGVHTGLSDEDYTKFKSGPPAQADDLKHFAFPPVGHLPQVNLPEINLGGSGAGQDGGGAGSGIHALPAPGYSPPVPPHAVIDVDNAKPVVTAPKSQDWMSAIPNSTAEPVARPQAEQMAGIARQLALPASSLAGGLVSTAAFPGDLAHAVGAVGGQAAKAGLEGNPLPAAVANPMPLPTGMPQGAVPIVTPDMLSAAPGKRTIEAPTGRNPLDSETLMGLTNKAGITNRPDLVPRNAWEKAEAAGMAGVGMVAPTTLTGGVSSISAALRLARQGVGFGLGSAVGGDVGQAVAGAPGRVVGSMVGGVTPALAGHAIMTGAGAVRPMLETALPVTSGARQNVAARSFAGANTPEVRAALAKPPKLVPGSPVTSYQATGNPVLGAHERGMANRVEYAPAFNDVRHRQNAARVASIEGQAPKDAEVGGIVPWFHGHLARMRAEEEAETAGERAATQGAVDAMGNPVAPHEAGAAVRGAVEAARAPQVAASDRAIAGAQGRAERATAGLGGEPGENATQRHGERMRGERATAEAPGTGLQGRRGEVRSSVDDLYKAVDPNRDLVVGGLNPVGDTAAILRGDAEPRKGWTVDPERADYLGEIAAAGAADLDGAERKVLDFAAGLRNNDTFQNLRKLLRMTSAAQRTIAGNLSLGRESLPYKRMSELRDETEAAMSRAAGEAAQGSSEVAAKLAIMAKEESHGPVAGGGDREGNGVGSGGGATGVSGASRETVQGSGGPANAGSAGGLAVETATRRPQTLHDWLISKGGVKDESGEFKSQDLDRIHHRAGGRLINPKGMSHDYAREGAVEEGFLPQNATVNDFRDAVASQKPVYRIGEAAEAGINAQRGRQAVQEQHDRFMAGTNIQDASGALGVRLTPAEEAHATELHLHGADPNDAVRDAVRAGEEDVLQRNAEHNAVGAPGMPLAAAQSEMPVDRGQLTPNFTPEARDALKRANAAWGDYKARFGKGAVGNVLASDSRTANGYRVPDSMVPSALFQKGAKGAEAADSLISAADRDGALKILGDYPAYSLRQAAEEMGTLSVPKYEKWARDFAPILDKFPELKASFDTASKARAVLDDLKADRAAIDATNPLKGIEDNARVMSGYVQPGPRGYEAAARLVRDTNGSPEAMKATRDYLAETLRNGEGGKTGAEIMSGPNAGTLDLGRHSAFMKRFESFLSHPAMADVKASFEDAGRAQQALDSAAAEHRAAQETYQTSVALHFLPDQRGLKPDPIEAIGNILRSRSAGQDLEDLARQTASDPVAREAIQAAVIKYMLRRLESNNPVGGDLEQTYLKANETQNFIRRHVGAEGEGALRYVMTPEQLDALNNVAMDIRRANLSVSGNKNPGGSDTGLITSSREADEHRPHVAGTLAVMESLGEAGHEALGRWGRIGSMLMVPVMQAARRAGFQSINDLRAEALLHPEKMLALLARLPTEAEVPSRVAAIRTQLLGLSAVAGTRAANDEPKAAAR